MRGFIFQNLYDITKSLEAISKMENGSAERVAAYEELRQVKIRGGNATFAGIFNLIFGDEPCDPEKDQFEQVYHELFRRGSIHSDSMLFFSAAVGNTDDVPIGEKSVFSKFFGDTDTIDMDKIYAFKAQLGRAELDLCKLGAEFCSQQRHYNDANCSNFWDRIVVDDCFVKPLYLSNGALRQLSARRIATRQPVHLSTDLRYLSERQLAKVEVRCGEVDPKAVAHWLYGQSVITDGTVDLLSGIIKKVCDPDPDAVWLQLLSVEFGEQCSDALDLVRADVIFSRPLDELQKELRQALSSIDAAFLRQRHKCRV